MDRADVLEMDAWTEEFYGLAGQKPYRPQKRGYVYFVQSIDGGPIKIGWAADPLRRLASLQTARIDVLVLLAFKRATRGAERKLHRRFREHRVAGEWFEPTDALLAEVAKAASASSPAAGRAA